MGGTYVFEEDPVPEDPCPGTEWEQQSCAINGGQWDEGTYSCNYFCQWCEVY